MDDNTAFFEGQAILDATRSVIDALRQQWLPVTVGLFIGFPLLIRSLRYRRVRELHKQYDYPNRASMAKMTDQDAFEIQKAVVQFEFPFIFIKSLQFALFRV